MSKYIWQQRSWPDFTWKSDEIRENLHKAKLNQKYILEQAQFLELKDLAEIITSEAITTSSIEGEILDHDSIRSSVANRLGLSTAGLSLNAKKSDGVVEMLIDATTKYKINLTDERLWSWQAALFPTGYSGLRKIKIGSWRSGKVPMQVLSGMMGKEKIHYEAPPANIVSQEMGKFISWWNSPPDDLEGITRAAIAHFWFITIHPFDDGNGRVARAITDMALAQNEMSSKRLYSLSSQILKNRKIYYKILEQTQKGSGDLTNWINFFLSLFSDSIENTKILINRSIFIGNFYKFHADSIMNKRQNKVIKKLLEYYPNDFEGGLTNKKYVAITKISPETAKRDIKSLVEMGFLLTNQAKGRSTSYRLNTDIH